VKTFLREPLAQFLLLGAGLFFLYQAASPDPETAPSRIVVDAGQVARLAQQFERTWLRPPSPADLSGLIDGHVQEEILYREALALGLEKNDLIIRRRLAQKMEFLHEDPGVQREPTDAELQAYLDANEENFRAPARTSFRQVYLKPGRDGAETRARAEQLRVRLAANTRASGAGDTTLLPPALEEASDTEISQFFGEAFAKALKQVPVGAGWNGPIESGYGLHFVNVSARDPGGAPPLSAVRPAVEREWRAARRAQASEDFYATLRKRYTVTLEQ
jgi:PPIC-type PPIASE domain